MIERETVVPFALPRERLSPPSLVRSTLLASSLRALRDRGHQDAYLTRLDPAYRETLVHAVAGVWLPIAAGAAHYSACDALGLSAAEQIAIGREVGDRIQGTFLASMMRAAKVVGVTPWNALPFSRKLYERLFDGGGLRILKLGPKEASCEMAANPLVASEYFRNAFRGVYQAAIELFCARVYVTDAPNLGAGTLCRWRISWA